MIEPDLPQDESDIPQVAPTGSAAVPLPAAPSFSVWQKIRIPKNDWVQVGFPGDASKSGFADITAIKIEIKTNDYALSSDPTKTSVSIEFDDWNLRNGGNLSGIDLQWVYSFYDEKTDTESDICNLVSIPFPGASGDAVTLHVPTTPSIEAPNPFISHVRLYRIGGTLTNLSMVKQESFTASSPMSIIDDLPDYLVGGIAETDNQAPPSGAKGTALHHNRLWIWGCTGDPANILRYSKANRVMSFPSTNFCVVGTGSEEIIRVEEFDSELIVFTRNRIYRVTGNDESSYLPGDTNLKQGIVSPFAIAIGRSTLYIVSYDGIYEFPSGKKISESINPLFHGETINGMSYINTSANARLLYAMGFWDNKVYFSYPAGTGSVNDSTLVYDTIYDRWSYYSYGVTDFFWEPYTDILVGANSSGGSYALQLENGIYDANSSASSGIAYQLVSKDLDLGAPDIEKRFVDIAFDGDTQGGTMDVGASFDGGSNVAMGTFSATGRTQKILPIPASTGNTQLARRMQLNITGTTDVSASAATYLYKAIPRFYLEPRRHETFYTDWDDYGLEGTKIFRELHIEMDTFGVPLNSIQVEVDQTTSSGGLISSAGGYNLTASGRTKFYYPLGADIKGTLARIKVDPTAGGEVKVYGHVITGFPESNLVEYYQHPWTEETPADQRKRFQKLCIELDNVGPGNVTIDAQIDATSSTITPALVSSLGRREYSFSFNPDTVGTVWRCILTAASGTKFRFYRAWVETIPEPFQQFKYESPWTQISTMGQKRLRDLVVEADTGGHDVTASAWVDGAALVSPYVINTTTRQEKIFSLPVDTLGKIVRLTATGSYAFTVYGSTFTFHDDSWEDTIIETKWSDEGAPNQRKRFRKLMVELDNLAIGASGGIDVDAQIDNTSSVITPDSITSSQTGRREYVFSFEPDTVGNLWRTVLTADPSNSMRFYRAWVEAITEPFQEYRYESPWTTVSTIGQKRLRDLVVEADTGGYDVTASAWVDGVALVSPYVVNTGTRKEIVFSLPVDTIGKTVRLTATGGYAFTIYNQTFTYFDDSWEDSIIETKWSDEGAPNQRKRFRKLMVELDNLATGATGGIDVDAQIDNTSATITPSDITASQTGRQEFVFSFEPDTVGNLWRAVLTADPSNSMRFYRAWVEAIPEPFYEYRYESPWTQISTIGQKRLRDLVVEADTGGHDVTASAWIDGLVTTTPYIVNTSTRKEVIFSLPVDTIGKTVRLTATGSYAFTIYNNTFTYFDDSWEDTIIETKWSDEGAPNQRKRFRKLMVEVDNAGTGATGNIDVDAQIDNASAIITPGDITASQTGRREYVFSFDPDTVGNLWRVVLTADPSNSMRFYRSWVEAIPEPFYEYRYESPWTTVSTIGQKRLRDLIVEADTGGHDVTASAWIDGLVLVSPYIVNTKTRKEIVFSLPVDTIGKTVRLTATGTYAFTIYNQTFTYFDDSWEDTIIETKWSDEGAPNQRKRFRKMMVEVDNAGTGTTGGINVDAQIDNASVTIIPSDITASQTGRREYVFSFEPDTVGNLWRTILTADPSNSMRFYRSWVEAIPEPFYEYRYESPWTTVSTIGEKRLRDLVVEADTGGHDVTASAWIDGVMITPPYIVNTDSRQEKIFSLPVDTIGKNVRLTATGLYAFTLYNQTFTYFDDSWEDSIIETKWEDQGAPNQRKRFQKLIIEVDNMALGATKTISVDAQIDGVSITTTPNIITASQTGRKEYVFSFNPDTVGDLWRVVLRASAGNYMRFYRAWVEAIPEPFYEYRYESPWDDCGSTGNKRFRNLVIDSDTFGGNVTITVWIDGAALPGTFTLNTNPAHSGTSLRKDTVFSLPLDTMGQIARITATGGSKFTIYKHYITNVPEPLEGTIVESNWSSESSPYLKLWREILIESDTFGLPVTVTFWLDGAATTQTFTVTHSGRQISTLSLAKDTIGKVARITISGAIERNYAISYCVEPLPPDVTYADQYERSLEFDRIKHLRRLWLAIKNPTAVNLEIYIDGVLRNSQVLAINNPASGYQKSRIDLPSGLKGKMFRLTLSSTSAFQIFWENSEFEVRDHNSEDGYSRVRFVPPSLM